MAEKKGKFIIIDGNAIVHRAYHALPPLQTKEGVLVNAVYGFALTLIKTIKDLAPDYLAVAFDTKEPTYRHREFKEYKAQREKKPQELYDQIALIKEMLAAFNIQIYVLPGYEADDLIATTAEAAIKSGADKALIVTGDMDTLQLVTEKINVVAMHKGISETIIYTPALVAERFAGLSPEQMVDFKALRGDPSDNIPGAKGIGEKTAINLLQEFSTLDQLYQAIEKNGPQVIKKIKPRILEILKTQKEQVLLSKKLVVLDRQAPLDFSLTDCTLKPFDLPKVFALFQQWNFQSLLQKVQALPTNKETEKPANFPEQSSLLFATKSHSADYQLVQTRAQSKRFLKQLAQQKIFALDTETTSLDPWTAQLVGIGFCWQTHSAYYLPAEILKANREELAKIFADPQIKKVGHNLKYDCEVLLSNGWTLAGLAFDTMIASYLLNPGSRQHNLDNLAFTELGHQMISIEELIGPKGRGQLTMDQVPAARVAEYCGEDADYTWQLYQKFQPQLTEENLLSLLEKIEMPLLPVLIEMEKNGVLLDLPYLKKMSEQTTKQIEQLAEKVYHLVGHQFNINSPKQLKEVLFEELEISTAGLGKTKTGFSTAAEELSKLKDRHPIIPLISDYRELTKLKNTYLEALPTMVSSWDGRVHTSFNQTVTATGRLSSSEPNLQNIPIRTELGALVRNAFIAPPGYQIISADYSQIELRIVASLANDRQMIAAFAAGADIHTATAAKIFNQAPEKITKQQRRAAKTINFGIIYGMGAFGLAEAAEMTVPQARDFIKKYFTIYSQVKEYLEEQKKLAQEKGYTETWFGRRRYFPEINSGVPAIRASAERMAINHPVQGTAADLMKLAMIAVAKDLPKISPTSKILLQVHDELVLETPQAEVTKVAKFLAEVMEGVAKLRVPIAVEVEAGPNWGEMQIIKV